MWARVEHGHVSRWSWVSCAHVPSARLRGHQALTGTSSFMSPRRALFRAVGRRWVKSPEEG